MNKRIPALLLAISILSTQTAVLHAEGADVLPEATFETTEEGISAPDAQTEPEISATEVPENTAIETQLTPLPEEEPEETPLCEATDPVGGDVIPEDTPAPVEETDIETPEPTEEIPEDDFGICEEAYSEETAPFSVRLSLQPDRKEYEYTVGDTADAICIQLDANAVCEASYAWYFALPDEDGVFRGERRAIENENSEAYVPRTDEAGTYLVFAEVTAVSESGEAAVADSDIIRIEVTEPDTYVYMFVCDPDGEELIKFSEDIFEYDLGDITAPEDRLSITFEIETIPEEAEYWILCSNAEGVREAAEDEVQLVTGNNTVSVGIADRVYTFRACILPTLKELRVLEDETELVLADENGEGFDPLVSCYEARISTAESEIMLEAIPSNEDYTVEWIGSEENTLTVADEPIEVTVSAADARNTYLVTLKNAAEQASFVIMPEGALDAAVTVTSASGTVIEPDESGIYSAAFSDETHSFIIRKYGYIAVRGTIPAGGGVIEIEMTPNSEGTFEEVETEWTSFRGDDNMGITDAETPVDAESTDLLWSVRLGDGWSNAPSVQIIVDNALIVMCANKKLYKLDLKTGDIIAEADMAEAPNWGYTPPSYAQGVIVCPLANGTIQAFNAKTLQSIWVYKDPKGGQSVSPITISDGYVYTGFWNSYTRSASYVCLSLWDDRTAEQIEQDVTGEKETTWSTLNKGGYYWAGSLAVGSYLLVGGDDGSSKTGGDSAIHCYDKRTGEVIDTLVLPGLGDQRSSIAYSGGRIYFTTKDGYICSAAFNESNGHLSDLKYRKSVEGAESTSTPVVYEGKVYFGVGAGYTAGQQQNFVAADADTLETCFTVNLQGNPQCSMLLSTAYEDTGYLYFYSTYNTKPGGISLIKVKKGATSAEDAELIEIFDAAGFEEYCITSLICGKDGTLYYKNDSGAVMAVGVSGSKRVVNLINAIGTVSAETIDDNERAVRDARTAYDALDESEKAKVTNLSVLEAAEAAVLRVRMEEFERLYALIPEEITKENAPEAREIVSAARLAYDALTAEQKTLVGTPVRIYEAEAALGRLDVDECVRLIDLIPEQITTENEGEVRAAAAAARAAYDQLTAEQKSQVSNYNRLTEIEERLSQPLILECIELINMIPDEITIENLEEAKKRIDDARSAYDALTAEQKIKVTNYDKLAAAEAGLSDVRVKECIRKIDLIPTKITEANKKEAQDLVNAAKAYYESLTDDEKAKVTNYSRIRAAQREINRLDAEGSTHSISDEDGAYELSEATTVVIEIIAEIIVSFDPALVTDAEMAMIIAAVQAYAALTEDEQLFVSNYGEFEAILKAAALRNHFDSESGLRIWSETLPWNLKLIAGETDAEGDLAEVMNAFLNGAGTMGKVYYLRLTDVLTGEPQELKEPVTLYLPCEADAIEHTGITAFFDAGGMLNLLTGEFVWIDPKSDDVYLPEENAGETEEQTCDRETAEKLGLVPCIRTEIASVDSWYGLIDIPEKWDSLMDGIDILNFDVLPADWTEYLYIPEMNVTIDARY